MDRKKYTTGNAIVDQVSEISFTGNITPMTWYRTLCADNGKPYLIAIILLSDIVYWYRASEVRDENSGELLGFKKKFRADFLQRNYQQICQMFNISKKQAREALRFLSDKGVIIQHLRDAVTKDGTKLHNVMYLELVSDVLYDLTYPQAEEGVVPSGAIGGIPEDTTIIPLPDRGGAVEGMTNTETSSNNTTKTNHHIDMGEEIQAYQNLIKENIEYENLINRCDYGDKESVDEIVDLLTETVAIEREHIMIAGVKYPYQLVKGKLLKLNSEHIRYVMDCMKSNTTKIRNIKNYLLAALYNAPSTINHYYQAEVNHDLYGI